MTMVHNLGSIEVTPHLIRSSLLQAARLSRTPVRTDASGNPVFADPTMIDRFRGRLDGLAFDEFRRELGPQWHVDDEIRQDAEQALAEGRIDALTPGPAGFLRDFDYVHREILEEARPALNSFALFAEDTSVPLGAPTHSARRAVVAGRAKWHNKGASFPIVKAGYLEETFRTGFVVLATEQSFFEGLQLGFAGLQTYQIEARGAIRGIEEFLNDVAFYGDPARQIYGALTYPDLAKSVTATPFTSASTPDAIAAVIQAAIDRPMISSGGVFRPNRVVTSESVRQYIATTRMDASGSDMTILEFVLKGQSQTTGIRDIEIAHELSAAEMTAHSVGNPAGYHGILAYNDDIQSVAHVLPQRPTFLPLWQSSPIDTIHAAFGSTGGIVMRDVGNNHLLFVSRG